MATTKTSKKSVKFVVKSVTRFDHTDQVHMEGDEGHIKLTLDTEDAQSFYVGQPVNVTFDVTINVQD